MAQHAEAPHWTLLLNALRELTSEAEERLGLPESSPSEGQPEESLDDGEQASNHDASEAGHEEQHGFRNIDLSRRAAIAHEINIVRERMLQNDPTFNEAAIGYRDFEHFALMAASLNILAVSVTGSSRLANRSEDQIPEGKLIKEEDADAGKDEEGAASEDTKEAVWVGERVHINLMPGNLVKRGEGVVSFVVVVNLRWSFSRQVVCDVSIKRVLCM
jgi:hypothetical protein